MLWFSVILGGAGVAVAAYNRMHQNDPDSAEALIRTLRQITAIVIVIARTVVSALDALTRPQLSTSSYGTASSRYWSDRFDEE